MILQEQLKTIKSYIQLSENDATKRDELETFLDGGLKTLLLDADSLLFNTAYFHLENDTTIDEHHEDFLAQVRAIVNHIEGDGVEVGEIIYFFTTCKNNFRKKLLPTYKKTRPVNDLTKAVSKLKKYCITELKNEGEAVKHSDTLEADDLIANWSVPSSSIVCSIDKDLKQLNGAHFDYYKVKTGLLNEFGDDIKTYKGWSYTTKQDGYELLLNQLLIGDTSDNIKGVDGIGKVKAAKLLKDKSNFGKLKAVYLAYNDNERLRTNIKLMKL